MTTTGRARLPRPDPPVWNPIAVQILGVCSALAVTSRVSTALADGRAALTVTLLSLQRSDQPDPPPPSPAAFGSSSRSRSSRRW